MSVWTPRWQEYVSWIIVGMVLVLPGTCVAKAGEIAALQVHLTGVGRARLAGDHETVTATISHTGTLPLHDVFLLLSLLDVSNFPAVPQGLEDWTPHPDAVHAVTLAPGAELTTTWKLRIIQAGRLAIVATALCGSSRAVTNSEPLVLSIAPTHNLTSMTVLPVAIGVPLVLLGGNGALLWHRYRLSGR
jgi:hypothetical protein